MTKRKPQIEETPQIDESGIELDIPTDDVEVDTVTPVMVEPEEPVVEVHEGDLVTVTRELTSPYGWIPDPVLLGDAQIDRIETTGRGDRGLVEEVVLVRINGRPGEHAWRVSMSEARAFRAAYLSALSPDGN